MMFRLNKKSAKVDSANAVQLKSFNHINGDSSSQESPCGDVQMIRSNQNTSKAEIIGPTGTVRGYKNMIRERKEILRLSFVGETFEVDTNLFVVNYLCEQLYLCDED